MNAGRWTDAEARRYAHVTRGDDEETVRRLISEWFADAHGWPLNRHEATALADFTRRVLAHRASLLNPTKGDDR